jgi:hypothetical protein
VGAAPGERTGGLPRSRADLDDLRPVTDARQVSEIGEQLVGVPGTRTGVQLGVLVEDRPEILVLHSVEYLGRVSVLAGARRGP